MFLQYIATGSIIIIAVYLGYIQSKLYLKATLKAKKDKN